MVFIYQYLRMQPTVVVAPKMDEFSVIKAFLYLFLCPIMIRTEHDMLTKYLKMKTLTFYLCWFSSYLISLLVLSQKMLLSLL